MNIGTHLSTLPKPLAKPLNAFGSNKLLSLLPFNGYNNLVGDELYGQIQFYNIIFFGTVPDDSLNFVQVSPDPPLY